MPVVLKKKYKISGNYTDEQKSILESLIQLFRISVADDDPEKNILNKKMFQYSDDKIIRLLDRAMNDINGGEPATNFTIFNFAKYWDNTLIVDGAIVFALMAEGILQLRNQIDFNDSGLSVGLFNKAQMYQGWASFLLQNYMSGKAEFKQAYLIKETPTFYGIESEFSYYWW